LKIPNIICKIEVYCPINSSEKVKKIVIPSKKLLREKTKIAKLAFDLVRKQSSKYPQIVTVEFGGSYSKGTWLPDKADVDIFVKFEKETSEKKFVEIAKKIGFNSMKKYRPYVRYSDHPYVEATIEKTKVNVVPCYDVEKSKWQSAADRSPCHTQFMLESLSGQMKDEIRILKEFLKNLACVCGVSMSVCEYGVVCMCGVSVV